MQYSLRNSEWILVFSLVIVMGALFLISKVESYCFCSLPDEVFSRETICKVTISGAVKNPGEYSVQSGSSLKKIIQKSKPNNFADLKKINLDQRVESSMSLQIDELSEIKIRIIDLDEGSVEYCFPKGTKLCDLKKNLGKEKVGHLKGRRMLKDGEILDLRKKID